METTMLFEFKSLEAMDLLDCADLYKFITQFNKYNQRQFKFKEILSIIKTKGRKPKLTEEEEEKKADEERRAKYRKKEEIDQTKVVI